MMAKILIRYAEIGLKGKNLSSFENQLVANMALSLKISRSDILKLRKQFLLTVTDSLINQSVAKLKHVFGIAWFAPVIEVETKLSTVKKSVANLAKKEISAKDTFAIKTHRNDKMVSFTSREANVELGTAVGQATNARVDLTNPDKTIYLDIGKKQTFIYSQKISGPGGLPVGSSGKVLSLISGGFDSIASSYLLAKRGAQVDFAHFHVFAEPKKVLTSKIKTIVNGLKTATFSQKLFLLSYLPFQMETIDLPGNLAAHELVMFRRLMVRVACELAKKHGYEALILGDSLGQVASQTLSNIVAVDAVASVPVFRPLIGMDKKDIIDLVRELNLEEAAIKPYKDCCSIISKSPATKAHPEKIAAIESKINLDKIIDEIASEAVIINL